MFEKIKAPLYLQVEQERLRLTDTYTRRCVEVAPLVALKRERKKGRIVAMGSDALAYEKTEGYELCRPFADPAKLLENFEMAEKLLRYLLEQLGTHTIIAPLLIVHPMGSYHDWVSAAEQQFFYELGLAAGARDVAVYAGKAPDAFDFYALKPKTKMPFKEKVQYALLLLLAGAAIAMVLYASKYGV